MDELNIQKPRDLSSDMLGSNPRKSHITGQIRGQVAKSQNPDKDLKLQVSSIFGGPQKPKAATQQVNVRKAKDEAMAWIRDEIKRYDQGEVEADMHLKLQATINNIQKEQQQQINE